MTLQWQQIVVALMVVGAGLVAFWRLAPDALRLRMLGWIEKMPLLRPWAARQRTRLTAGGCAGCAPGKDIHPKR